MIAWFFLSPSTPVERSPVRIGYGFSLKPLLQEVNTLGNNIQDSVSVLIRV
jgi:hypothetical protein